MTPLQARRELRSRCAPPDSTYLDRVADERLVIISITYDSHSDRYEFVTVVLPSRLTHIWFLRESEDIGLLMLACPSRSVLFLASPENVSSTIAKAVGSRYVSTLAKTRDFSGN